MTSPVIGDDAASPSRANVLSGTPSRDKVASASLRTDVCWTDEAFIIALRLCCEPHQRERGGSGPAYSDARHADLLPNHLSQRLIDPILPARSGFLKVIKNVPVNSQRDKLLGVRDSRTLWREFRGLRGCRLERRFSSFP
jgi:hypothetical protein